MLAVLDFVFARIILWQNLGSNLKEQNWFLVCFTVREKSTEMEIVKVYMYFKNSYT